MNLCLNADQARRLDEATQEYGITGMELMERAARACEKQIIGRFDQSACIVGLCGTGNNGGDGLALSRMLSERGYLVSVIAVGDEEKASGLWIKQMELLSGIDIISLRDINDLPDIRGVLLGADVIVDAIFGIGLSREIGGVHARLITAANALDSFKLSIDVPSGVATDTGTVLGGAFRADVTVTFGYLKPAHILHPGRKLCGEVIVEDIGFIRPEAAGISEPVTVLDGECLLQLPERDISGNKGTFGRVFIRAGSPGMAGAALLCGEACYRSGTGLVYISSPEENRIIIQTALPEAVYRTDTENSETINTADAALVGPGLSTGGQAVSELITLLRELEIPLVLDADAINIISSDEDAAWFLEKYPAAVIMTPHPAEMGRLLHMTSKEVKEDLIGNAVIAAKRYNAIVVLKDASTVITDGEFTAVSCCGSDGAATGGSGDVLSGIIAGLLGQGADAYTAACAGVYAHDMAGAVAASRLGRRYMLARDIIGALGEVLV